MFKTQEQKQREEMDQICQDSWTELNVNTFKRSYETAIMRDDNIQVSELDAKAKKEQLSCKVVTCEGIYTFSNGNKNFSQL